MTEQMTDQTGEFHLFVRDGDELVGSFAREYATVLRELVHVIDEATSSLKDVIVK